MVMTTETRNLDHTGVLSVVEVQKFTLDALKPGITRVRSVVRFESGLGNKIKTAALKDDEKEERRTFFGGIGGVAGWGTAGVQRTIESFGVKKMGDSLFKTKEGMKLVLERLRRAGVSGVTAGSGGLVSSNGLGFGGSSGNENRWRQVWRSLQEEMLLDE